MEANSGILEGLLAVPKGGGSLQSLGERFQPDLLRGTGNYSVPIEVMEGPNGIKPQLSFSYSTGQGNGPYGLGWQLNLLRITRRTDQKVPTYTKKDEFILAGADILIEVSENKYRPASDTQFWDIRREGEGWIIRTKKGQKYYLGTTPASRIDDNGRIFAWLIDREEDVAGNTILYTYQRHENQLYIDRVSWSIYHLNFIYENRSDCLHEGRAGFAIKTSWRCQRVELHCQQLDSPLLKAYQLEYSSAQGSALSLLRQFNLVGYGPNGETESYAPLKFTYTEHRLDRNDYHHITAETLPPPPLDDPDVAFVDMNGDGLPDILQMGKGVKKYWPNLGSGHFGTPEQLVNVPIGFELSRPGISFADLNGDGTADLFRIQNRLGMYIENTGQGSWAERPIIYEQQLNLKLSAANTRLVDLDGDGVVDLLQSGPHELLITYNQGDAGWSKPESIPRVHEPERFPDVDLSSPQIHFADMTGDGLMDLVFVDSGRVEYWPYFGYGNWGERIRMKQSPVLPAHYQSERLFLTDLDGDGTTDLVYVDYDQVYYWLNQSGQGWSERYKIHFVPPPQIPSLQMADLLGNGTRGLVWNTDSRRYSDHGYRFLDLSGGVKPYLLTQVDNGMGGITQIEYTTTSQLRQEDGRAGLEWKSYLPFPIHVVSAIEDQDLITSQISRTQFRYHRGYYDSREREFRGFENVEVEHLGDASYPTVIQKTRFYQGIKAGPILQDTQTLDKIAQERALAGSSIETQVYEISETGQPQLTQSAKMHWEARQEYIGANGAVYYPHLTETEARDHVIGEPDRINLARYHYDQYGNLTRKESFGYFAGQEENILYKDERMSYTENTQAWLVGLLASLETRDGTGKLLRHTLNYYDGNDYQGLDLGQVEKGLLMRSEELALANWALPPGYQTQIAENWGYRETPDGLYRRTVAYAYDSHGNVIGQWNGLGLEREMEYDSNGLFPIRMTDPLGHVTEVDFEPRTAQPVEIRTVGGQRTRYQYSPLGRLQAQFDTAGDGSLQLTQVFETQFFTQIGGIAQPSRVFSIRMLESGQRVQDYLGKDQRELEEMTRVNIACDYYNHQGNLLQRVGRGTDASDGSKRWVVGKRRDYNVQGQPAADYPQEFTTSLGYVSDPPGETPVRFYYTASGQKNRIIQPDGSELNVRYLLNRIEKWDANSALSDPPMVEYYNAWGHLMAVAQPDGSGNLVMNRYTNDLFGRPLIIEDANSRILVQYTYAGPGKAIRIQHADAGERTYWYDANNQLRLRHSQQGRKVQLNYDVIGRMTTAADVTNPDVPMVVRDFTYTNGKLAEIREMGNRIHYTYDQAGRIVEEEYDYLDGPTWSLQHEYGLLGELRSRTYPDGTQVEYQYDDSESIHQIPDWIKDVQYDAHYQPIEIDFMGNAHATYNYQPGTFYLQSVALASSDLIRRLSYQYDANGGVEQIIDEMPNKRMVRSFSYDKLYRLTQAVTHENVPGGPTLNQSNYGYNSCGDLTQNTEALASMTYGDSLHEGRLTQIQLAGNTTPMELRYDAGGRMQNLGQITTLHYDCWDRLERAVLEDGTEVHFTYDHQGNRMTKEVISGEESRKTCYIKNLYEGTDAESRLSVYLGKLLVALQKNVVVGEGERVYVLTDQLGTFIAACDVTGQPIYNQVYSPFGLSMGTPHELDAYIGLESDLELGLVQMGARYYAPILGRFITPDWYIIENPTKALRIPQGFNVYSYAINNPIAFKDSTGLWFGIDDLIVAGIGFVVGFIAGTIYGLATGQGWNSLLIGLEAGLLGAAGAWLGWNTAGLALGVFGLSTGGGVGFGVGVAAAVVGGFNGVVSGSLQIYDWSSPTGWLGFLSDSTWGLVGTALGDLLHLVNWIGYGGGDYQHQLSKRQNRHVYDGGFGFGNFAFTQGNVISNVQGRHTGLLAHETLHVWQSRIFGPIYQGTYVVFLVVGGTVGFIIGLFSDQSLGQSLEDMAYYNNPFEYWAYSVGGTANTGDLAYY